MSNKLNNIQKLLNTKGYASILKKQRKNSSRLNLVQAAKHAGMPLSTYCTYESGSTIPRSYALAAGLLLAVGTPEREIHAILYPERHKPLRPAPVHMTRREEALIQWFDQQLERCIRARKPLAALATLCYALEFNWIPWKSAPQILEYLKKHSVSFTRERVRVRINDIRQSFKTALNP